MSEFRVVLDPPSNPEGHGNIQAKQSRSRTYLPGETVTGKVVLVLTKDDEIPCVLIRFRGKLKVVLPQGKNNTRKYRYTIFSVEKTLFRGGQYKMRATRYEWPFEFIIPRNYTLKNLETEFDPNSRFIVTGTHPLPPSCNEDGGDRQRAVITYKLFAHVPRTYFDWSSSTLLYITPARLDPLPDLRYVVKGKGPGEPWEHHRYRYSEDYTPRTLTKREILSDTFHGKNETQQVEFDVEISAPTTVVVGKSCPISVRVITAPTEMVVPDFKLIQIEVKITYYTHVRVSGTFGDHSRTLKDTSTLCLRAGMSRILEAGEWAKQDVFPEGETRWSPNVPSFTSMAIERQYEMSIRLKVMCLEKEFRIVRSWPRITFLPMRMEEGVEEAAQMIENNELSTVALDGEVVPDYEAEASGSGELEVSRLEAPAYLGEAAPPPSYKESQV